MADTAAARDAYYAYGVDLIRTAGLLLHTTPSTVYRASMLFQRFEASVDAHFRARYISAKDMPAHRAELEAQLKKAQRAATLQLLSPHGSPPLQDLTVDEVSMFAAAGLAMHAAEYLIPSHAQHEMSTGLVPLVDLHAPLDYCVHHLIDQEDIVYLAAACLLIATKMEDPAIRIRAVINTCMRISQRRAGVTVNDVQKPPPARYEEFKACVVDAEEEVLHQLGFQTFVECPYKFVLLYLSVLVEPAAADSDEVAAGQSNAHAAQAGSITARPLARPPPALTLWAVQAVQLVNDLPRCQALAEVPGDVLALYAIQQTCPTDLTLPAQWSVAFGVGAEAVASVAKAYAAYLRGDVGTRRASAVLSEIRAQAPVAPYRTVSESEDYKRTLAQCTTPAADGAFYAPHTAASPPFSNAFSGASGNATETLSSSFPTTMASIEELRDLIGASFPSATPPSTIGTQTSSSRRGRDEGSGGGSNDALKRSRFDP